MIKAMAMYSKRISYRYYPEEVAGSLSLYICPTGSQEAAQEFIVGPTDSNFISLTLTK